MFTTTLGSMVVFELDTINFQAYTSVVMSINETERRKQEVEVEAQELIQHVEACAVIAMESPTILTDGRAALEYAFPLLHALAPGGFGVDEPRVTVRDELLLAMTPRQALAITLGQHFCAEFEREFGPESGCMELLENIPNSHAIRVFYQNLAQAILARLQPDDPRFPEESSAGESLLKFEVANKAFIRLTGWANEELGRLQASAR